MTDYTPGPWHVVAGEKYPTYGIYADGKFLMSCSEQGLGIMNKADACLMSAAPDLLEALQEFATQHHCGCGHPACNDCWRDKLAEDAIRKATAPNDQVQP